MSRETTRTWEGMRDVLKDRRYGIRNRKSEENRENGMAISEPTVHQRRNPFYCRSRSFGGCEADMCALLAVLQRGGQHQTVPGPARRITWINGKTPAPVHSNFCSPSTGFSRWKRHGCAWLNKVRRTVTKPQEEWENGTVNASVYQDVGSFWFPAPLPPPAFGPLQAA
jgi:hypothetical protein